MREEFWNVACEALPLWRLMLSLVVVLLVMLGISFPFLERGEASYYISLFALSMLLPLLFASGYAIRRCSSRGRAGSGDRPDSGEGET